MNRLIFTLPLIFVVFLAGCAAYGPKETTETETPTAITGAEKIVEITSTGFSPNLLTINVGDKVVFVNRDNAPHWPASDVHPTHCEYKGCGVFDARRGMAQGESYPMVFDLAGNWRYHDHLNPGMTGNIIVQ
ncbi:MAG: hypothetical protein HYS62_02745 [Candidatus Aenigmarchaeota archaeon]|nr:hypothetical protein [Candidatus Aenigmarchaeota archaeon]